MSTIDSKYSIANHLDSIRREANISIGDFCEGICSERQYSRYLNGSQLIRQEKLNAFCDKIGFTAQGFYRSFYLNESRDYNMATQLYKLLYKNNNILIKRKLDELNDYEFTYPFAKKLYQFCILKYQYLSKQVPLLYSLAQYSELIDYPNVMNKKHVTFIDLITLVEIARTAGLGKKDLTPLEYLYDVLVKEDKIYVSSDDSYMLPSIYFTVSQFYGSLGDLDKCIMISNKGIAYHHEKRINDTLPSLYYFKALSFYKKGNKEEAYKSARKCLYTHISKEDIEGYRRTCKMLHKDFGIDPMTYLNIDGNSKF